MEHSIILFDGVCNLCTSSVKFIIKRDKRDRFRFAALQSEQASQFLSSEHLSGAVPSSVLLLENGKLYKRSTAALRIARQLNGVWPLLYGFIIVPPFIRDFVYDQIGKRRYIIWGKLESCMVPTPDLKAKFL